MLQNLFFPLKIGFQHTKPSKEGFISSLWLMNLKITRKKGHTLLLNKCHKYLATEKTAGLLGEESCLILVQYHILAAQQPCVFFVVFFTSWYPKCFQLVDNLDCRQASSATDSSVVIDPVLCLPLSCWDLQGLYIILRNFHKYELKSAKLMLKHCLKLSRGLTWTNINNENINNIILILQFFSCYVRFEFYQIKLHFFSI